MITTERFQMELPERKDRVLVGDLTTAFQLLDADAANLRVANVFEDTVEAAAFEVTSVTPESGNPDYVLGVMEGQKRLQIWPRTAVGQEPEHTWTWTGAELVPTRGPSPIGVASVRADATVSGGSLFTAGPVYAYGGAIYFEGSNAVSIQWRGDLGALWIPYGNGVNTPAITTGNLSCQGLYMPSGARGDRPPYVLAQYGDGWAAWVASDAVGRSPPGEARVIGQYVDIASVPTDGAGSNLVFGTIGAPWTGQYVAYLVAHAQQFASYAQLHYQLLINGGNAGEGSLWSGSAGDGLMVGLCWGPGFLGAGSVVQVAGRRSSDGYSQSLTGTLYLAFLPTWDYPS